jgi:predicted metalloprotease
MQNSHRGVRAADILVPIGTVVPFYLFMAHAYEAFPFESADTNQHVLTPADYGVSLTPEQQEQHRLTIQHEFDEVEHFWTDREQPLAQVSLALGEFHCDEITGSVSAFYCLPNDTIFMSPESLQYLINDSDSTPELVAEFVVSHEFAHAMQDNQHEDFMHMDELEAMSAELQADCLAAVAMTEHSESELGEVELFLNDHFGDKSPVGNRHGTGKQRAAAFRNGLDGNCPEIDTILSVINNELRSQ